MRSRRVPRRDRFHTVIIRQASHEYWVIGSYRDGRGEVMLSKHTDPLVAERVMHATALQHDAFEEVQYA